MDNHRDRPEIESARVGGEGVAHRLSPTLGIEMMYLAIAVRDESGLVGYARAALPESQLRQHTSGLRRSIALGAGLAAVAALLLGLAVARRVTQPLASMTEAAQAIAAGDYDRRIPIRSRDELGRLAVSFNTMSDRLQQQLEMISADRARLTAILAGMIEGVIAVDAEQRVVHMNRVAASLLSIAAAESLGKPIARLTAVTAVPATLARALSSNTPVHERVELRRDNRDLTLELYASPLRDGRGVTSGAVLVLHDTTEIRRLEDVRRDFVANVSHELKTPLTAIKGFVETLLDDEAIAAELRQRFLTRIRDQCERLASIVTDLLSLSRLEAEEGRVERELLDLREPVHEAVNSLAANAEAKRLEVGVTMPQQAVIVSGNAEGLTLAVANLLDNAIKYSPPGKEIRVRVRELSARAVVEVEDEGPGIDPSHHGRIFERFYRVDKARSRELGGTGLGLAIVKHTALAMGGEVEVESALGKGSTFRILLPCLPAL
jgi:two-component system phosphate regulon sensor histidine kinase PhoR